MKLVKLKITSKLIDCFANGNLTLIYSEKYIVGTCKNTSKNHNSCMNYKKPERGPGGRWFVSHVSSLRRGHSTIIQWMTRILNRYFWFAQVLIIYSISKCISTLVNVPGNGTNWGCPISRRWYSNTWTKCASAHLRPINQ